MAENLRPISIDRTYFFDRIKKLGLFSRLTEKQVAGMSAILDEWEQQKLSDNRQLAYIFATIYHETYDWNKPMREMYPTREKGTEQYLKSKPYYPFYGRDFCHTTWRANYVKVRRFTGIDVVTYPDKIAELPLAAKVCVHFMVTGLYTGRKLADYISGSKCDYINARRVINGTDKANLVAGYAIKFESSLRGQ